MTYGIIATDTIQSSTTGTPPQFNDGSGAQIGTLCRAWVNFSYLGTIAASFNVSSITKVTTAVFTVTFTKAFPDANYAFASGTAGNSVGAGGGWSLTPYSSATYLAGSVQFTSGVSNANYDVTQGPLTVCFFR